MARRFRVRFTVTASVTVSRRVAMDNANGADDAFGRNRCGTPVRSEAHTLSSLEQSLHDKNRAIDELNETAGAFKLLHEKQTAEINAKDILLARKHERIEELLQQLHERGQQLQAKEHALERFHGRVQELESEIHDLTDQLEKEEQEFAMLRAVMEANEQQLTKRSDDVATLKDAEKLLLKDVERLQSQLRKLEEHVDELHPETLDACLSPRSFSENQLIQLRDDAISAKTKEIWLLTGKNDQLRVQLDELEAELEQLQTRFVSIENDLSRRDRKIEKLEADIEALQVSRQQADGRERAMEIATTQNAKLLQALQALESQSEDAQRRLDHAERECQQLRQAYCQNLERSAVNEVDVLHKSKEAEHKSSLLATLQAKLARERKSLHDELAQERIRAQLEVEKLQSELVMRRNKQYELTLRLQEVEATLHHATDELDTVSEQLVVTKMRMEEAERVLQDALVWKRTLEDELTSCRSASEARANDLEKQRSDAQAEVAALKVQLKELKESLLKSLDDGKNKDFRVQDLKRSIEGKDQLVVELKDRTGRLVQEAARAGQARAKQELERRLLAEQLDKVKQQMGDSLLECMQQLRRVDDKWKRATDQLKELEKELANEQRGKSKLVRLFIQAYSAAAASSSGPLKTALSSCLDLRECWLADLDVPPICTMLETNAAVRKLLTRVDLRGNRLTQESVHSIVQYVRRCFEPTASPVSGAGAGPGAIRELDLRGNFISIEGMRAIASTLQAMASTESARDSAFAKVMVLGGGRIECYPESHVSKNEIPLLTVDVTENVDSSALCFLSQPAPDKVAPRRRRDEGGGVSTRAIDPVLQEIYGLDLVSAFMGEPKQGSLAPKSSRLRRKSAESGANDSGGQSSGSLSSHVAQSSTDIELPSNNSFQLTSSPRGQPTTAQARDATRSSFLSSSASLPRL